MNLKRLFQVAALIAMTLPDFTLRMNDTTGSDKYESKLTLAESHYGMAVRRGSLDLLQWLNTFIYTYKQNGKLAALHEKYLHLPLPNLPSL